MSYNQISNSQMGYLSMTKRNELENYSHQLTLLYVDDDLFSLELICGILEKYFGTIITAVDGQDGIEKFKTNNIDLVITDIHMPRMNGLEMIQRIKEIDREVSVLILSAQREDDFFVQSIGFGVDGYLLKPVDPIRLEREIDKIIQKNRHKREVQSNLNFLSQHHEITNHSSIISKTDNKGVITYVNDAFCQITGYREDELIRKQHNIVRHPDNPDKVFETMWKTIKEKKQTWKGIIRNKSKNGKSYYVDCLIMPILNQYGTIVEYISLRNDITDIMSPEKQLQDAIRHSADPILVYMKLEHFDEMEELYDSETIELFQDKVSRHLEHRFSEVFVFDMVYQLGDGEYAFILEKPGYSEDEQELQDTLKKYQMILGKERIDFAGFNRDVALLVSLVYEKAKKLESAKRGIKKLMKKRENFIVSNNLLTIQQQRAKENMKTVSMIRKAIENSKIISYFQPIVDIETQKIVKYESLARLIDESDRVVSPAFFLDTAKKSDQYAQITSIVLEHSFSILKSCECDSMISINLSALDIEQADTRRKVLSYLDRYRQYTHRVVFELLEDESVNDFDIVKKFYRGCQNIRCQDRHR